MIPDPSADGRHPSYPGKPPGRAWLLILAVMVTATTISCAGPGYFYQAAKGQVELLRGRTGVDEVIADPGSDPELVARLETARNILAFAGSELGLPANDSYHSYAETGRTAVAWNVVVAPELSLQARRWCFPVAGCVPYRGYFDEARARSFAGRQAARGHDVSIQPVTAYSTLGWFSDPLLDTMLSDNDPGLAETLFHELAHQRLYVKGDTRFSESYATFVATAGVRLWLAGSGSAHDHAAWEAGRAARQRFHRMLFAARGRLADLYRSGLPPEAMRVEKDAIFDALENEYRNAVLLDWGGQDRFGRWFDSNRNNAALALLGEYHDGVCAFDRLFSEAGHDFRAFHELAGQKSKLAPGDRDAWLLTACDRPAPAVAQDADL